MITLEELQAIIDEGTDLTPEQIEELKSEIAAFYAETAPLIEEEAAV